MKNSTSKKKELSPKQREELLKALKDRFKKNRNRHKGLDWAKMQLGHVRAWQVRGGHPEFQTHFLLTGAHRHLSMRV